jgi:hypothetical protein
VKPLLWIWLLSTPLCAQDPDRDFTGTWRLKAEARQFGTLPASPASVLQIRHEGTSIHCSNGRGETPEHGCAAYKTDRSETRTEWEGGSISSRAKWEGRALLINSIFSGPGSYTRMERWTMSNDRSTLRIRRQIVGRRGEAESTLVYEREPAAAPAFSPVHREAVSPSGTRFGRRIFKAAGPGAHERIAGLEGLAQASKSIAVSCLAYEDSARIYVELGIRNQSSGPVTVTADSIGLEQAGRRIERIPTLRASEEIHAGALRPFTPTPTGKHSQTGEAIYDRASVDVQRCVSRS